MSKDKVSYEFLKEKNTIRRITTRKEKKSIDEFLVLNNIAINKMQDLNFEEDNLSYFFNKSILAKLEYDKDSKKIIKDIILEKIQCCNKAEGLKDQNSIKHNIGEKITDDYYKSIKEYCDSMNFKHLELCCKNDSRLIVGIGDSHVLETSMTLHHIYGVPYIPGQAFKGVVRSYFLDKYYDKKSKEFDSIEGETGGKIYKYLFGDDLNGEDNKKGNLMFFDVLPIGEITIEKDIMTPHYNKYYTENDIYPTDTENPVPITFYTVNNTNFKFVNGLRKEEKYNLEISFEKLHDIASDLIKGALTDHGIGAKTSVGYGYFVETSS